MRSGLFRSIGLLVLLVVLNGICIQRGLDRAAWYPFQRIALGQDLYFPLGPGARDIPFGSSIVSIDHRPIAGAGWERALESRQRGTTTPVEFRSPNGTQTREYRLPEFNVPLFWFFLFFLLAANIHYLWGFLLLVSRMNENLGTLYVHFSFGISIFYFFLSDFFMQGGAQWFIVPVCLILTYILYQTIGKVTGRAANQALQYGLLAVMTLLGVYAGYLFGTGRFLDLISLLFLVLVVAGLVAIIELAIGMFRNRNRYTMWRNAILKFGLAFGFVLPLGLLLLGLHADLDCNPSIVPLLSLLIPITIGNGILHYNVFSIRMFFKTGYLQLVINILIAAGIALFIYGAREWTFDSGFTMAAYLVFFIGICILLMFKQSLKKRIGNALLINKDDYTASFQNIAELVSSPDELPVKLEKIFDEAHRMLDVVYLKIIVFTDILSDDGNDSMKRYVEYIDKESPLYSFLKNNKEMVFTYGVIDKSVADDSIVNYLKQNGVMIIAPIIKDNLLAASLLIGNKRGKMFFTDSDLKYIYTVAYQIYQVLENDKLFRDYVLNISYERELDIASYIQLRLFPKQTPVGKGLAISFYIRPYLKVTGDYFDFISIDRDRTAIVIGDVSGHGLAAAMILSMTSSLINAMLTEKKSIEKTIDEINHFLNNRYHGIELITLFVGIFNKKTKEMVYINAGHCPPLYINSKTREISYLEGRSKILGADPHASYFSSKFNMKKGDELFFYTDGAIEIYDERTEEQVNEKELIEVLRKRKNLDIIGKINALVERINSIDHNALKDDITLIGVRIL